MKLPIKKKYFDEIKSNMKDLEYRDAHITFVCEETGETLFKRVVDVSIRSRESIPDKYKDVIHDDCVIVFELS